MAYAEVLGTEPGEITCPDSVPAAIEIVKCAVAAGQSIIPWGGGTGQTFGYCPRRNDILLDLSGLNRIIAHEFADLTVTVEPGVTLAQLQNALAEHNQFLPLDPQHSDKATIGGIIACNAFGPGVVGAGMVRDWLIGISVIDAQGRLVKGGGKVVKNVTGYDIPKLHVGALGTLGVIVEATFKVAPRPEASRAAVFTCLNPEFVPRLHDETAPAMSLLRSTSHGAVLAVLYSGLASVVESEITRAAAIAASIGEVALSALPGGMPPPFSDTLPDASLILRFSGSRNGATERHNKIAYLADWQLIDTLPGTGQTDAYLGGSSVQAALEKCLSWAESEHVGICVLHAPIELRQSGQTLWQPLPASLPLMRRMKETLDPENTLNPGRFVGEI